MPSGLWGRAQEMQLALAGSGDHRRVPVPICCWRRRLRRPPCRSSTTTATMSRWPQSPALSITGSFPTAAWRRGQIVSLAGRCSFARPWPSTDRPWSGVNCLRICANSRQQSGGTADLNLTLSPDRQSLHVIRECRSSGRYAHPAPRDTPEVRAEDLRQGKRSPHLGRGGAPPPQSSNGLLSRADARGATNCGVRWCRARRRQLVPAPPLA